LSPELGGAERRKTIPLDKKTRPGEIDPPLDFHPSMTFLLLLLLIWFPSNPSNAEEEEEEEEGSGEGWGFHAALDLAGDGGYLGVSKLEGEEARANLREWR
jgi:hypothetical protein